MRSVENVGALVTSVFLLGFLTLNINTAVVCKSSDAPAWRIQEKEQPGLGNPEVHKITDDVYAVTGLYHSAESAGGVSAGVVFTENSVVFIDAGMTIASGEFLWNLVAERLKGGEEIYLILTHHHSDHVFGMRVFKDRGAKVIAHSATKWFIETRGAGYKQFIVDMDKLSPEEGDSIYGDVLLAPPDQTIEADTVLNIDGVEIDLLATPGHVPGELSVYLPSAKVIFAGDTVYEGTPPHTRFGGPAEWREWIAQLDRLKRLNASAIVPGHGKLCDNSTIDENISHLEKLLEQ
jgi:glyoxylase-like metal-dependent hydrolase (beta-lactamase superfamily II)